MLMTYRSVGSLALLAVCLGAGGGGIARAQAPGGGGSTPLPLMVDLKKVPVGSWSEYRIADGQNNMNVRMALVGHASQLALVETEIKGGPMGALGHTTVRMSLPMDETGEVKPKDQVIQVGDNAPMILPQEMTGGRSQSFKKLDPKKRVGVDSVTVPAGAFPKAEHYQDKGPNGETIDFWVSKGVLPFGLVKVKSSGGPGGKDLAMELTGQGSGAKAVITKTPQPFDAAAIMRQAQPALGGAAGPAGAGGPPMRPIPSPHPGMPGTMPGAAPTGTPAKDAKK